MFDLESDEMTVLLPNDSLTFTFHKTFSNRTSSLKLNNFCTRSFWIQCLIYKMTKLLLFEKMTAQLSHLIPYFHIANILLHLNQTSSGCGLALMGKCLNRIPQDNIGQYYCHTRLHLGFSAKLRIWQVSACKMEPQSGFMIYTYESQRSFCS